MRIRYARVSTGRPYLLTPAQIDHARTLIAKGKSPRVVVRAIGVGKSTLYRHLQAAPPLARAR